MDQSPITEPAIMVGYTDDGLFKIQYDMQMLSRSNSQFFGMLLSQLTKGFAETYTIYKKLPISNKEQMEAEISQAYNQQMLDGPNNQKPYKVDE